MPPDDGSLLGDRSSSHVRIRVELSSVVLQAGISALLVQLGFTLAPPDADPDLLIVDEAFLLGEATLPDLPLVGVGDGQVGPALLSESAASGWAWLAGDLKVEELRAAVLGAAAGLVVISPSQLTELVTTPPAALEDHPLPALHEALTVREREVLDLVAQGLSNKRIALRLAISENTVKFHLGSLFSKLGVNTRAGAATRAIQLGLTFV